MFFYDLRLMPHFSHLNLLAGESGSADTVRDPRGFAVKFYTEDGNWDLVGNNTPIFFIRDAILVGDKVSCTLQMFVDLNWFQTICFDCPLRRGLGKSRKKRIWVGWIAF